jgi:hypothetical protein
MPKKKSTAKARKKAREYQRERLLVPHKRAAHLHGCAKFRAKKKDLDFTLTREWVEKKLDVGFCEATGLWFELEITDGGSRVHPFAPSIDRINPKHGYTPDNCQLVVSAYNTMKNEYDDETIYKIAEAIVRRRTRRSNTQGLPHLPHVDVGLLTTTAAH